MSIYVHGIDEAEVGGLVQSAERQFAEDVERIRYRFDNDWAGEAAVFVNILLRDKPEMEGSARDMAKNKRLYEISNRIIAVLKEELRPIPIQAYFAFRLASEQKQLRDPEWD